MGANLNGGVGDRSKSDKDVMGRHEVSERNVEGQVAVDFAKRMELAINNTFFVKKPVHRITYSSSGQHLQMDLGEKAKNQGAGEHEK